MPHLHRGVAATLVGALGAAALIALPTAAAIAAEDGIRINEVESSQGEPGDWIEFHNPTGTAIALGGFTVTDSKPDHTFVIPAGTIVDAGGFLVLDKLDDGTGDFDFGLGGDDQVRLIDPEGALVTEVSWTEHAATTWGVQDIDGGTEWVQTSASTKGAANTFEADGDQDAAFDVVVNEIIYDDISGVDSDSIELYNAGADPVDIGDWTVTDEKAEETGTIPAGTTLAPGDFLLLEKDVDFEFGLGKGDAVVLSDATGAEVDAFAYENTAPIAVWARCPDGTGEWAHATEATPGTANICTAAPVEGAIVINEVDSQPADWVEFFNPGDNAVDIAGYEIRDNSDDHRWAFVDGTVIEPGEFLLVEEGTTGIVDGEPAAFRDALGIGSTDRIRLFDPAGVLVDDTLPWEGHAAVDGDSSFVTLARCPDGQGRFGLADATPGEANSCIMPNVAINEIESNGDATDWAEIVNLESFPVDISGWTLMDDDPFGHAAETAPQPEGTILEAGAYFVFDQPNDFQFGLGGGDTVTIRDANGNTVAEHVYADHADGVWGRCVDGTGDFLDLAVSTKGMRNACGNPVRINEVESDGGDPDDWIELANPTATELDVSGIVVRDDDDDHRYEIPAGTVIAANGYLVLERADLGFGLGKDDSVRLYDGDALIDETSWGDAHVAPTWGRCPDVTGVFAATAESTKNAANICPGEIAVSPWPGSAEVSVIDELPMFLSDGSGLDVQETADGAALWAVDNGEGRIWKLDAFADGSVQFADGWDDGKRVRFQKDAGDPGAAGPDTEGITVDGAGNVYVASERDNNAKGVNYNVVLKVDPDQAGEELIAVQEWDLTELLPEVNANLGAEAVEWISDAALEGALFDDNTQAPYDPATYTGRGDGLFFVAVEDGGGVFAIALGDDGSATLVAELDPGLPGVMGLDYDTVLGVLWAMCDDGCQGRTAQVTLNGTATPDVAHFAPPAGLPDINNEGFATAPASLVSDGQRPVWWFADGYATESLRTGMLPAQAEGGGDTGGGDGAGDAGGDTDGGLAATGSELPAAVLVLALGLLFAGAIAVTLRRRRQAV